MNSLEKKLKKDSAFVIGTNTSSCWVVRLSRVNEELGVIAKQIREKIQYWEKESKQTGRFLIAQELQEVLGLLVDEEEKP